jgi:hypothetical protein
MKKEQEAKTAAKRRQFLKLAGLGTLSGAAAAAIGGPDAEAKDETGSRTGGYRETEHVRKAYELARF